MFDLWGTLAPLPDNATTTLAAAFGIEPGTLRREWLASRTERETGDLFSALTLLCERLSLPDCQTVARRVMVANAKLQRQAFDLIDADTLDTLKELRTRGLRIGLITNASSDARDRVEESPLHSLFDTECYSSIEGVMKPSIAIYERAAARLEVAPSACLYVGDGVDAELEGAMSAGMTAIQVAPHRTRDTLWISAIPCLTHVVERPIRRSI